MTIEPGETPLEALTREIEEELELTCTMGDLLYEGKIHATEEKFQVCNIKKY